MKTVSQKTLLVKQNNTRFNRYKYTFNTFNIFYINNYIFNTKFLTNVLYLICTKQVGTQLVLISTQTTKYFVTIYKKKLYGNFII